MKTKMSLHCLILASFLAVLSIGNGSPDELDNPVVSGLFGFSREFSKVAFESKNGNLVCSPLSVAMTLLMLKYGADTSTKQELTEVLRLEDDSPVTTEIQEFVDTMNNFKKVTFKMANKIFVQKKFAIEPKYKALTKEYFRAESENVDFRNKPDRAATEINSWTSKITENKIEEIVSPDMFNSLTSLVLVNAVYFKGIWARQFNTSHTTRQPFYVNSKTIKSVHMMHQKTEMNYGVIKKLGVQFVQLPYERTGDDDEVRMYVLLPTKNNNFRIIEKNLDKIVPSDFHSSKPTNVNLSLPKFKVESEMDLKPQLNTMGLKEIFSDFADFSGISQEPLKVTHFVQKAFLEVNEQGTEAAAATAAIVDGRTGRPPPEVQFNVNQPFAVLITSNDVILFSAKITNPTP